VKVEQTKKITTRAFDPEKDAVSWEVMDLGQMLTK
jgi:hypothetical protein